LALTLVYSSPAAGQFGNGSRERDKHKRKRRRLLSRGNLLPALLGTYAIFMVGSVIWVRYKFLVRSESR
jgi:hypothetical protein